MAAAAEEHLDDVGHTGVHVVLGEGQSARHAQQLVDGDGVAGIGGVRPLGDVGPVPDGQQPPSDEQPGQAWVMLLAIDHDRSGVSAVVPPP